MIKIDISNSIVKDLGDQQKKIAQYLDNIYQKNQGFYTVVDNEKFADEVIDFAAKVKGKYDDVVVLGIGGSALGPICLHQSLKHLHKNDQPQLYVLDNIDPILIKQTEDVINLKKTLFVVISKSGDTPETIAQYFYFRDLINKKGLEADEHFVFVTDAENGLLRKISKEEKIPSFEIPENIGGRFSVLTTVGLLPAALIGIDVKKLIKGAREIRDTFYSDSVEKNLPFQLAAMQYSLSLEGKNINVLMPYSQKLIRFADWYRQLLAESTGKKNTGLTPVNALGATDQHSQSQLYNEGPNDKFFIFIKVEDFGLDVEIPAIYPEESSVLYLKGVSFKKLIHTEQEGTTRSLTQNGRPNITITIDSVNEETLGGMFMLFECATAFLGEFFGINAFDQPGVELSKKITKQLLT